MYVKISPPIDRFISFVIHYSYYDEEWKEIIEANNEMYFVSNYSRILSLQNNSVRLLKKQKNSNGYERIQLSTTTANGVKRAKWFSISHLVAQYFIGDIPNGFIVHHRNIVKDDNYYKNLQIMSSKDHIELHNKLRSEQKNGTIKDNSRASIYDAT